MDQILEGKTAIVTGGGRGIGAAIVKEFALRGAAVYFSYSRSANASEGLVDELRNEGLSEVHAMKCSVTDPAEIKKMVDHVRGDKQRIDILVNNAGITRDNFMMMMPPDEWDEVIRTNLYGVFNMTKAVSRVMVAQKEGVIVNIASVAAIEGSPGQSNYAASKGGIISFTKCAAMELAGKGVRMNCILPGFIQTDMTNRIPKDIRKDHVSNIPLRRMGTAKEIADAALFMASDMSSYMVGQSIIVDGGLMRGAG